MFYEKENMSENIEIITDDFNILICELIFDFHIDETDGSDKEILEILSSYFFDLVYEDFKGMHFYGFFQNLKELEEHIKDALIELEAEDPDFASSLKYKGYAYMSKINMKELK